MLVAQAVGDGLPEAGRGDVEVGGLAVWTGTLQGHEAAAEEVGVIP